MSEEPGHLTEQLAAAPTHRSLDQLEVEIAPSDCRRRASLVSTKSIETRTYRARKILAQTRDPDLKPKA
jgi:hypothetical protein